MSMITRYQEVTDWGDVPVHNGIYHLNEAGQLVAYETENGVKVFSKPMKRFSKARRKFQKLDQYPDPKYAEETPEDEKTWKFTGSKGDTYIVTEDNGNYTCTCPGFKYRGRCKHSTEVASESPLAQAPAWH